jgi:hypothetical protein
MAAAATDPASKRLLFFEADDDTLLRAMPTPAAGIR